VLHLLHCVLQSHRALCEGVSALARRVQSDRELTNLIRRKFAIKCTTGAQA
jgi:D-lactate dehydrogenase